MEKALSTVRTNTTTIVTTTNTILTNTQTLLTAAETGASSPYLRDGV
jgi:hypothetical protein